MVGSESASGMAQTVKVSIFHIEHMFDMEDEKTVMLRGGRFDGQKVAVDPKARELWAYQNMYGQPRAVRAGGLPRSESMVTYRLSEDGDVAQVVESS
jgi:hypothetical protein